MDDVHRRAPKLTCIQFPEPGGSDSTVHAMRSSQSRSRTRSKTPNTSVESRTNTRKSSAYHRDFEQHLTDHRIYTTKRKKPTNWDEIQQRLEQPRQSLSPSKLSDGSFEAFQLANEDAITEAMVMRRPFSMIQGDINISSAAEIAFSNLAPLTDGTLVDAKPDFYDGVRPEQLDLQIRDELGHFIAPSTQQQAPCLPSFFVEGKGPDGSAAVAKRQACYNGALGARGMHELQRARAGSKEPDNGEASTFTSTFHDGTLKMYTSHLEPSPNPKDPPTFYMNQLGGWALTGSAETYREGVTAFRNARELAQQKRDQVIAAANGRFAMIPHQTTSLETSEDSISSGPTTDPAILESETSADELSQDMHDNHPFPRKRPRRNITTIGTDGKMTRTPPD